MIVWSHIGHDDAAEIFIPQSPGKRIGCIEWFRFFRRIDEKTGRQHPVYKKDKRRRIIPTINVRSEMAASVRCVRYNRAADETAPSRRLIVGYGNDFEN
jgi:hypothetical protein